VEVFALHQLFPRGEAIVFEKFHQKPLCATFARRIFLQSSTRQVSIIIIMPPFPPSYAEEDIGSRTLSTAILFIVLEVIVVTLRFTSRRLIRAKLALDDYLIIPSLVFCLGICVVAIGQ
jgi:hypothetical protein